MRGWLSRSSDWVASHPVRWGVGLGVVLVLLGFALDLAPMVVIAAGTAIGRPSTHASRRCTATNPAPRGWIDLS